MQFMYNLLLKSHNTLIIVSFFLNTQTVYLCKFENTFSIKVQNRKRYLYIRDIRQLYNKVLFMRRNEE